MAKGKKARESRVKNNEVGIDEQTVVAANQVCEKELTELNGGKLSEQTDAGAEILLAQETAVATKAEGAKPNGQDKDTQSVVKIKPLMLTDEAEAERRKSLDEAHKASYNLGLRMVVAVGYPAILAGFPDRPADSIALDEFIAFRNGRLAELPEKGNYHRFSWEANWHIDKLYPRTKKVVQDVFKGRYNVGLAEVKAKVIEIEKSKQLSVEAEMERLIDIKTAFKKSENEGKRMKIAVSFRAINEVFANDAVGSVTPEQYRGFRDSQLLKFAEGANYHKFSKEALELIRSQEQSLQDKLNEAFVGELDVQLSTVRDELMLLDAEQAIRHDRRKGIKIDEEACVQKCATDHDDDVLFVAMAWMEKGQKTGNFFLTENSNEVKPSCDECRESGVKIGVQFHSLAVAMRKMKASKSSFATFADAVKMAKQQQYDGNYGGQGQKERKISNPVEVMTKEAFDKANDNFYELLDTELPIMKTAEKFVARFMFLVGPADNRTEVESFLFIEKRSGNSIRILDAGPGLREYRGEVYSLVKRENGLPPKLFKAIILGRDEQI